MMNKMQRKKVVNSIFKRRLKKDIDNLEIIKLIFSKKIKINRKKL